MERPKRLKVLEIYNKIWSTEEFPCEWTEAIVIPILKPGKDPNEPTSYRQISLSSCMCKTMERIINRRILHVIEERKLLPETQYDFRKKKDRPLMSLSPPIASSAKLSEKKVYSVIIPGHI
jgi:hypothetical protein